MQKNKNLTPFYAVMLTLFLIFSVVSIGVFFRYNRLAIRENAKDTIQITLDREQSHFENTIELQYEYLEGIADYLGKSTNLITEDSLRLINNVAEKSSLDLIALIDSEGTAYYSNGSVRDLSEREYFQTSMSGERSLSEPVESKVDGTTRVIFSVPILHEEEVVGVLGGSYDISALGDMLINEIYEGSGQFLIVSQDEDGTVISQSGTELFDLDTGDSLTQIYKGFRSVTTTSDGKKESFSVSKWIEDLENGVTRLITLAEATESYYCYYEPLGVSNWMLCYIVNVEDAHASYSQFTYYETRLFQVLAIGVLVVLLIILVVTFRKQKNLVHFAETDALTGICNKKTAEEYIKLWLADEACDGTQVFLMLDVDHFKEVNDVYGHAVGDIVLSAIGNGLREIFRDTDIIGRLGGDEFGVFMKNATPEMAVEKAEMVCQMVRSIKVDSQPSFKTSCSIGVSLFPQHAKNFMDLYQKADKALYISKNSGRNQFTLYDIRTME
ncbi:MAG: sensor domain-containing diguanylate cyclase [Lachnospiraceae bacterium]|nr:sensor domain-containing diguanylate cyclase [Lachnospiraceae bacterium]